MKVEVLSGRRSLKSYLHEGQLFVEAPAQGAYEIRLTNDSGSRRLAVVSVDAVNVLDGATAGHDGPGYVLRPWESITISGWRRSDSKVAKFTFQPQDRSYANQTGRGTQNNGVIGVAVFDEKVVPVFHHPYPLGFEPTPWIPTGQPIPTTIFASNTGSGTTRSGEPELIGEFSSSVLGAAPAGADVPRSVGRGATYEGLGHARKSLTRESGGVVRSTSLDLGTGYGKEVTMHTETTTFNRAAEHPAQVVVLRYAVREKLIELGVPVDAVAASPNPFPASAPVAVPAPPGWRGGR